MSTGRFFVINITLHRHCTYKNGYRVRKTVVQWNIQYTSLAHPSTKYTTEKYNTLLTIVVQTFCLASLSLKRSKSVRVVRFFLVASFLAHAVFSHFSKISPFSKAFLTGPLLADGPTLILKSVRERCLKFRALRQTLVHGPSIRAFYKQKLPFQL